MTPGGAQGLQSPASKAQGCLQVAVIQHRLWHRTAGPHQAPALRVDPSTLTLATVVLGVQSVI